MHDITLSLSISLLSYDVNACNCIHTHCFFECNIVWLSIQNYYDRRQLMHICLSHNVTLLMYLHQLAMTATADFFKVQTMVAHLKLLLAQKQKEIRLWVNNLPSVIRHQYLKSLFFKKMSKLGMNEDISSSLLDGHWNTEITCCAEFE